MSRPPASPERFEAWARGRGLELGSVLGAIRPDLESLLGRLLALGDRLPSEAAPPPEGPAAPRG